MNASATDRELVDAVIAGDPEAAAIFVERFFRFIAAIAGRFAKTRTSLTHNVSQNVIRLLWDDDFRRLRMWSGEDDFASYLAPIVKNKAVDYLRNPWNRVEVWGLPGEDESGTGPLGRPDDGQDALLAEDRRRSLVAAIDKLGPRDREVGPAAPPQCEAALGIGTSTILSSLPDGRAFIVVGGNAAGDGSFGHDSEGHERPGPGAGTICP